MGIQDAPKVTALEHFDWLVKYKIREIPYGQIAKGDQNKPEQQSVADGVKSAAELVIGPEYKEWLRPGKPGRPPRLRSVSRLRTS
jgi:hypothetical protein